MLCAVYCMLTSFRILHVHIIIVRSIALRRWCVQCEPREAVKPTEIVICISKPIEAVTCMCYIAKCVTE